jgi:hypothetical protein
MFIAPEDFKMSTLHQIIEYEFHNRKPSKKQVMGCIDNAIKGDGKAVSVSWGENCLEVIWHDRQLQWYGYGWIKNIGGDDIAHELNRKKIGG